MKGKKGRSGKSVVKERIPNPGSDEALYQGCTCPVLDNYYGEGFVVDGKCQFWTDKDCPLHGHSKSEN